jgi:hypothetical protein
MEDSTEAEGAACNDSKEIYCGQSLICMYPASDDTDTEVDGTCMKFCCGESDCKGQETCTPFDRQINQQFEVITNESFGYCTADK